ncbi:protein JTB [Hyalella azteca]|uniref:Protein JTB n=1 Tax=Hyalella azteca TaxID=294128 RepID=A0A8B7NSI7_HYAAZ|nr:protein JTB [Hyalella azteca]
MIESCSRKQMIIAILCLIGLSVIVLVVENILAPYSDNHRHNSSRQEPVNMSLAENCWSREEFKLLEECQPCTDLELKSRSPVACGTAHYRQKIECNTTGVVFRTCDRVVWLEERHFLVFELSCLAVAIAGYTYTTHRHSYLQDKVLARISQQLAAGV